MADEMPVCDVLCEAMEYLTKLGSNLRSRSESLKEKKIRRDKLKNAHAVQKAASKVLLICELSKKSLENVENGVKRVLRLVDAAQTATKSGGKRSNPAKSKSLDSRKDIKISGKRYKLHIPRNINLKHYTSVSVYAKSLPKEIIKNYPVYLDCKLYKLRQKKHSHDTDNSVKIENGEQGKGRSSDNCEKMESNPVSNSQVSDAASVEDRRTESENAFEEKKTDNTSKKCKSPELSEIHNSEEQDMNEDSESDKTASNKKPLPKLKDTNKKYRSESRRNEDKLKKDKCKKYKKLKIMEDSSDEEESKEKHGTESDIKDNAKSKVIDVDSTTDNEGEETRIRDKYKDNVKSKEQEETKPDEDSNSVNQSEEMLPQNKDEDVNPKKQDQTDNEDNMDNQSEESTTQPSKPLIKCVNISRLLKPDVLVKETAKPISDHSNGVSTKIPLKNNKGSIDNMFHEIRKTRHHDGKESSKKIAVKNFKPKQFVINVFRLPKFSNEFLQKNQLKKIIQNDAIIYELKGSEGNGNELSDNDKLLNSNKKELSRNKKSQSISTETNLEKDIQLKSSKKEENPEASVADEAKNALLNDSDGEKPESPLASTLDQEREHVKNSLLHCSESDQDKDDDNSIKVPDTEKSVSKSNNDPPDNSIIQLGASLQKYTEELQSEIQKLSNNTVEPNLTGEDQDKELAKSSLLNDSSDCTPKKSPEKSKNRDNTTPSRRKHIMESMHAKKMLLTYSSSSDTEDEQLKNVIKDIQEDLLKNIGSDQDEAKNSVKKKLLSSSDSDEDILKRAKKIRKLSKSKSPPAELNSESNDKEAGDTSERHKSDADSADDSNKSTRKKMGRSREKPGGSSSPNSDAHDDKDIDGLTNLKSLNKTRRRQVAEAAASEADTSSKRKALKIKLIPLVAGDGLLEAPDSSDEASDAGSDSAEEELPTVSLSGLNGSSIEHLAKDDLLEESESDDSKDKSSQDIKKEDSDAENVKSKRRKANTISSDSEAGSSRKKERGRGRLSDFDDSEAESSEPMKRSKRKKVVDSDVSDGSSNEDGNKKRRRIKQINDSDVSGSDTENEGKSKHGRKNIRKVMGKNQLEEATKKAARQEKERVARIAERQKTYNNLEFDESGKPDEVVLDKVVLDFDPETKEPLIQVDRGLVKKLKPHQANGIKFMWDACFESVKRIKKDKGSGCILAHCMGLGKTLQVVSLTHTLLIHSELTRVNRVLVVCPLSTVLNWVNEFKMWLKHAETDYDIDVYELSRYKQNSERAFQLSQWFQHGGVCVLGYEMFRNLSADNVKKFKKKMLRQFQESLVDPGPDLVVCDEGHLLKNEKTSLSQSMNRVKTLRRIVLTGTPLQNNLKEYYCMVQFVKPNLLGKYNEYLNRFVNPITNGQYTDSTEHDIRVMKRRSHVLHKMLDGAVQRRDYGVLAPFLPPKHEYVLFITLTDVQTKLYQHYLDNYSRRPLPGKSSGFLFPDFQSLQRIWTHPLVLKYNSERYEIMQQKKREREEEDSEGSLVDFIDDDSTPDESSTEESSDDMSDASDDSRKKSKKKKSPKKGKTKESKTGGARRGTRANPGVELEEMLPDPDILEVKNENPTEWWIRLVEEDELEDVRNSHKLVLLFEILRQCEAIGDKLLVFSQSLYSLDLIEHFLGKVDEATQEGRVDEKLGNHVGSWSPGIDYFRLDGSTSCENRSIWCKNFNREDNPRARLFLISTRAGGLGINLVAANRVVIFDVSWNPSHDVQSIFRVYRFGQKKPCYVYRFLAMGTMEEKIYERQVTKQAISKRVIDEQQIDRHYAENDLAELYKFEPRPPAPRPVPLVPKDRFFAEMLKEHEAVIYKFHEHDSLLENKEEETLSEEERKAAWDDFENEKNRPPPAPFPSWPMHNGMVPNLLAQQQQQLAYAALAQMLRKDMPNLSDDNIRNMLPIIYGTNPGMFGGYDYGLMQKLTDIYKYAQPGMMNPGMMNPVMNAGGASGGMGGGGTSGLQYEPPWQRQQQQQQQMRLQQLMQQQQNSMGAKFYAGGLGSRDPVAMALQQQRAREIMLGNQAASSRPRGRPPLAPRTTTAPGDVVNLDSD